MSKRTNKVLKEPEILLRIAEARERMADDELPQFEIWERRAKKNLILLSLKGHEGIDMLMDKAREEIKYRHSVLKSVRPINMSPSGVQKYAQENAVHFMTIDMWTWFLQLFVESQAELDQILTELNITEEREAENEVENMGTETVLEEEE